MSGPISVGAAPSDLIAAFFSTRSQQVALALQETVAKTRGVAAYAAAQNNKGGNDFSTRTITLELLKYAPANSNGASAADGKTVQTVNLITLDVTPYADGYAQTIEVSHAARQSVHQTAAGYYVDEFNEATGSLNVDVEVIYKGGSPGDQVQAFIALLHSAKLTEPLSNEAPRQLRYFDTFLGRSYTITQDTVRLRLDAERQNRARLTISATILYDYSVATGTSNSTPDASNFAPPFAALTSMTTPLGQVITG